MEILYRTQREKSELRKYSGKVEEVNKKIEEKLEKEKKWSDKFKRENEVRKQNKKVKKENGVRNWREKVERKNGMNIQ